MTDEASDRRAWWRLGASARPWLHALAAAAVGAGAAKATQVAALSVFFVGPAALIGLLLVTVVVGAILAALAVTGTGVRRAGWIGLEAVVLVPATLAAGLVPAFLSAAGGGDGDVDLTLQTTAYVLGALLAGVPALLMHRGPARALGLVAAGAGVLLLVVVASVHGVQARQDAGQRDQEAILRAQAAIGADFRPVTVSPHGYGSIFEANIEKRLPGFLQVFSSPASKGHAPGTTSGDDLTVVTLASATDVCGRPIEGVGTDGAGEPETSCTLGSRIDHRTSAHGHEASAVVGDVLVAVSARSEVDVSVLEEAVHSAKPIGDAAYRHVLLGDGDEYTDQLDGNRCPITGVVCG